MWRPKKLSKCKICDNIYGRSHDILTKCNSWGHTSYGVKRHSLCYWCYESLATTFRPTPIEYLVSDEYHLDCIRTATMYDESYRWTRKELNSFKYFISENIVYHHHFYYLKTTNSECDAVTKFTNYRNKLILNTEIKNTHCAMITTVKLLATEESYLKYVPPEILLVIISYLH